MEKKNKKAVLRLGVLARAKKALHVGTFDPRRYYAEGQALLSDFRSPAATSVRNILLSSSLGWTFTGVGSIGMYIKPREKKNPEIYRTVKLHDKYRRKTFNVLWRVRRTGNYYIRENRIQEIITNGEI